MATIINLEAFPKVASEAIEFSYFLSESEKAEWRDWLKTATPEQQEELVDILYSMWQDNQKNAVPENLGNNTNLAPAVTPVAANNPIPVQSQPAPIFNQPQFNPQPAPQPVFNNSVPTTFSNNPNPFQASPTNQFPPAPAFPSAPIPQPPQFNQPFLNPAPVAAPVAPVQSPFPAPTFNPVSQIQEPILNTNSQFPGGGLSQPQQQINSSAQLPSFEPATPTTFVEPVVAVVPSVEEVKIKEPEIVVPETKEPEIIPEPIVEVEVPKIELPAAKPEIEAAPIMPTFNFDDEEDEIEEKEVEVETKRPNDINMESLVNDNKYRPNPILDNDDSDTDFVFNKSGVEPKKIEKAKPVTKTTTTAASDAVETEASETSQKVPASEDQPIDFNNLKDLDADGVLHEIYNDYRETNDVNQKKFGVFLDKITKVLSNYEIISSHFENLTGKVVNINDKMVAQAQDIQALKDATQTQAGTSIQEQIDDLRFDVDNMEKDLRTLRTETRRKSSEISQQLAGFGANSLQNGGLDQKIELIKSEIQNLKLSLNSNPQNSVIATPGIPTKSSKLDLTGII